jgi:endonuclease III
MKNPLFPHKILNDDKNEIKNKHFLNHLLVLHGRYICTAKKPKCDKCLVANACNFYKQNNEKT